MLLLLCLKGCLRPGAGGLRPGIHGGQPLVRLEGGPPLVLVPLLYARVKPLDGDVDF